MASCVLGIMYHISAQFDEFVKKELKKRDIPIQGKHSGLFMILFNFNNRLEFKEIADKWIKSKSTLCDIVSKYEELGLVEREQCSLDKRNVYIKLTPKGMEYAKELDDMAITYLEKVSVGLSQEQKDNMMNVLQTMVGGL